MTDKRFLKKKIKPSFTGNHGLFPKLMTWMNNSRINIEFKGNCLKQGKVTFTLNNVINLFLIYGLDRWSQDCF